MSDLQGELTQFGTQLAQIQMAIATLPDGAEKNNLITLEADIKELMKLTEFNMMEDQKKLDDPLSEEYKLFQAEIEACNGTLTNDESKPAVKCKKVKNLKDNDEMNLDDLKEELKSMEGMKCQAPYKYAWTEDVNYHNALIFRVEDLDDVNDADEIKVRVMFTNPTHNEMLPCPFYLDGECKFSDDKCKFSHGEEVYFSSLKDYKEPDFGNVTEGKHVFAKRDDGLWHRGTVKSIVGIQCVVKFDSNLEEEVDLQNILPLVGDDPSDDGDGNDVLDYDEDQSEITNEENLRRMLMSPPTSTFGEWEKFTKGIGSRIMTKMGYIYGSGLGKEGAGRVEPVPAVILPAGKSLDHCMMLREQSGGDEDFFSAEKRLRKLKKKHEKSIRKGYDYEKPERDVFAFLNKSLGQSNNRKREPEKPQNLGNESLRNLNITSLQLGEKIQKMEKEVRSIRNSIPRYGSSTKELAAIKEKLADREATLKELRASEEKIANEQKLRRDRKKLTVF